MSSRGLIQFNIKKHRNVSLRDCFALAGNRTRASRGQARILPLNHQQVRVNSPEVETSSRMRQPNKSRKSLAFTGESGSMSTLAEKGEEMLRRLNVDDLPQTGLQVKVVYQNPPGNVIVRIPRDDQTKTLVKNLACENWREVSNAILQHAELAPELRNSIRKVLSKEFCEYLKSETMLCTRNPDEIAGFSNKLFMEKARIFWPVWYQCVIGASGVSTQGDVNSVAKDHNSLALVTAILARVRNPRRPSTIGSPLYYSIAA